jgi:hypothetical protein
MPFLGVDKVEELERIPDDEDQGVVAGQIIVAAFSVKFDGEAARVPGRIRRALSPPTVGARS